MASRTVCGDAVVPKPITALGDDQIRLGGWRLGLWSEPLIAKRFKKFAKVFSYRIVCQWPKLYWVATVTDANIINILTSTSLFFLKTMNRIFMYGLCLVFASVWRCDKCRVLLQLVLLCLSLSILLMKTLLLNLQTLASLFSANQVWFLFHILA